MKCKYCGSKNVRPFYPSAEGEYKNRQMLECKNCGKIYFHEKKGRKK